MFVLMVAYATSVMRFKMRKPLMNMAVILNLFPGMLAMIAVYFTLKSFNLTNSYAGLIIHGLFCLIGPWLSDCKGIF